MPSSVARSVELEFLKIYDHAQGVWSKYYAACALLAHNELYTAMLRGNEVWAQKAREVEQGSFLDRPCPDCGLEHVGICICERTKTSNRTFDLCVAPVTGAGLHPKQNLKRLLAAHARLPKKFTYLFVQRSGGPWTTDVFWKNYLEPTLRRLATEGHPGMAKAPLKAGGWAQPRTMNIRVERRGATKFYKRAGADPDFLDLWGRWRPEARQTAPGRMQQRYYVGPAGEPLDCHDMLKLTSLKPPSGLGHAAEWS